MFERFGEMSSCREINELAENLLNEGDIQSLKVMAQENGIPEDYVEMYQSGDIPYLCDAVTAAMGKLDVECGSLKLAGLMNDWVEYIRGLCMEDEMVAHQVRKKGKSLKQCIAEILKYAFKNQVPVDKEIIKAAGVNAGKVTFGDPDMGTAKKLIRDYYLEAAGNEEKGDRKDPFPGRCQGRQTVS